MFEFSRMRNTQKYWAVPGLFTTPYISFLLLKEFCDLCHRPFGALVYYSAYIFGIVEKLLRLDVPFGGLSPTDPLD